MTDSVPQYAGGFLYNPETKSVLLQLRDHNTTFAPGKWSVFGGLCEGSESPKAGFVRELREELEVRVLESDLIPFRSYMNEKLKTMRHVFYVTSKIPKSDMVLHEGADFDWIPLENVFSYDLTDKVRDDLTFFIEENHS